MNKKLLLSTLLIAFIISCKDNDKAPSSPVAYNEDFKKIERNLDSEIHNTEVNVERYTEHEQYDSIAAAGKRMEDIVEKIITDIKDAPAPDGKGGAAFKDAGIQYFEFMKKFYGIYTDYGKSKDADGRAKQLDKLQELNTKKLEVMQQMQAAQKKFASDNGIKLTETKDSL